LRRRALLAALAVSACARPAAPSPEPSQAEDVRRLAAILDYVAADYGGAVDAGQVVSPPEYQEQIAFVKDARALAARIPAVSGLEVDRELEALGKRIDALAPAAEIGEACRSLRRRLLDAHGVVLAPAGVPSRARAELLYAQSCVACHGERGGGDGPQAANLKPPPRSFLDPEVARDLSPARAFSALTDGVDGTGMASWGALSPSDRWSLAFYVLALRHDAAAAKRGRDVYQRSGRAVAATPTRLAGASEGELERALGDLDPASRADVLAFLRLEAGFQGTGAPLDPCRRLIEQGVADYRRDKAQARSTIVSAYLDGFEPHEGVLRARDTALVARIEEQFFALRDLMEQGASAERVESAALLLGISLDRAEETLSGGGGARLAFAGAMLVILREGLEAALLLMLLLGLARRAGAGSDVRAVHAGWIAAVLLGAATWFASGTLLRLGGAKRELVEGIVALLAAGVLLLAGHWVLARLDAKRRVDALKRRFAASSPSRRLWVLFGLGFVAIYREAFEVVLFLRAIVLDASQSPGIIAAGAATGAAACVVAVLLLSALGRRLKPGPLLAASGTLLCALAAILAGKGVRALQEAGVLGIEPLSLPRVEWLGLFPSLQSVLAQLVVLLAFFAIAGTRLYSRRWRASPSTSSG
jgi:high-affinity iron transporter